MREIKFRVWDKKNKEWVGSEVGGIMDLRYSGSCNAFMFDNDDFKIPDDVEWSQFTGLLDRCGKEIYEGDIVENSDWEPDAHAWNRWQRVVVWNEESASFRGLDGEKYEVIGNIYEHEHLLKQ